MFRPGLASVPRAVRALAMSDDGKRLKLQPGAELYRTARWQRTVKRIRKRDKMTCQATGVMLIGKHPAPDSPVVDHKTPHNGDPVLFWDDDNLWLVSKEWHDSTKQSLDKRLWL